MFGFESQVNKKIEIPPQGCEADAVMVMVMVPGLIIGYLNIQNLSSDDGG